jgi:hypothetical protein
VRNWTPIQIKLINNTAAVVIRPHDAERDNVPLPYTLLHTCNVTRVYLAKGSITFFVIKG